MLRHLHRYILGKQNFQIWASDTRVWFTCGLRGAPFGGWCPDMAYLYFWEKKQEHDMVIATSHLLFGWSSDYDTIHFLSHLSFSGALPKQNLCKEQGRIHYYIFHFQSSYFVNGLNMALRMQSLVQMVLTTVIIVGLTASFFYDLQGL